MYEVENGSGELDSGVRDFCRTEEFVSLCRGAVDWWLVVDGSNLVQPPADADALRVEGGVRYSLGGHFDVEPAERGFVPDDLDHVGAHAFVMVPIVADTLGMPRCYWAKPAEQFVIRERVSVNAIQAALRLLAAREPAEGQRASAGTTAADVVLTRPGRRRNQVPGETTEQLPTSQVPVGVMGMPIGRDTPESAAVDFHSERESDQP